ncbi:Phosphomevalonate kinase [Purpureocillium takamizusanense]|uniref:phosphomevalonate kinase n=1 Tax=Purpureocillium takamizusanense TaxID=2060973 RepID=A0A9Q8VCI6_9HYPO|nr:Phosphomevalonate kinase [Purpureocillium takamizusanense]UNI21680.1 Phosphomevalonate kinase [Purpureocillium takamizusanense]
MSRASLSVSSAAGGFRSETDMTDISHGGRRLHSHVVRPRPIHLADTHMSFRFRARRGSKIQANSFVETTLSYALTYIAAHSAGGRISAARLIVLADNDYYSQSTPTPADPARGRFAKFAVPLSGANKTGLGSSAALVTSLTAALLSHYLPRDAFDASTPEGRRTLHNLAQAAHCAAQGKVGSGFDVAAAVYGSCTYRRFSPAVLAGLPEPGAPGFSDRLVATVDDAASTWDVEIEGGDDDLRLPAGVALRMCDVDCGSQTVGMVKKMLAWRAGDDAERATQLWDELQHRNEALAAALRHGRADELPGLLAAVRERVRDMGRRSGVPVEPEAQTELLDALGGVEGVYGGVVPGAGGYDALALLMRDDDGGDTVRRVEARLAAWSRDGGKGSRVRLLDVKGETEGVRLESLDEYRGWLA